MMTNSLTESLKSLKKQGCFVAELGATAKRDD